MGDFEKKIVSKQIAEIPALPIKQEIEKPQPHSVPPGLDRKNIDIKNQQNSLIINLFFKLKIQKTKLLDLITMKMSILMKKMRK